MKKIFVVVALILCVVLGGCKKQETPVSAEKTSSSSVSETSKESTTLKTEEEKTTVQPSATEAKSEPKATIEDLQNPLGTANVFGEDSAYAAHLLFKVDQNVNKFRFVKLVNVTYDEKTNIIKGALSKQYGYRDTLNADEDVILIGDLGETLPFLAVSYESESGKTYSYAIQMSGEDGHPYLTPMELTAE